MLNALVNALGSLGSLGPAGRIPGRRKAILKSILFSGDLTRLAQIWGSDKWGSHYYTPHYDRHFRALRRERLRILEIGVGGYDNPHKGGGSLRMWKYYFPNSAIHAIDIHDKSPHQEDRITIHRGSQNDPAFLESVVDQMGGVDIVIDDGSHVNEHVLTSFNTLFPLLAMGGLYVVEDTQTSYWPKFGGDSYDLDNPASMMPFFKSLADRINYEEIAARDFEPDFFARHITELHFYHNLVFIRKDRNEEGSNYRKNHVY